MKLNKHQKLIIANFFVINILVQSAAPTIMYALTGGPSQPEVEKFEPISTDQMVDAFTGDFTYNISLMHIPGPNGGYPLNMSYNAGSSMESQASWVGLGWNFNPGALVRNKQGLPDDFNGATIQRKYHIKPDETVAFKVGASLRFKLFGIKNKPNAKKKKKIQASSTPNDTTGSITDINLNANASLVRYTNTYLGSGIIFNASASIGIGGTSTVGRFVAPSYSLFDMSNDSERGLTVRSVFASRGPFKREARHSHFGVTGYENPLTFGTSFQVAQKKGETKKKAKIQWGKTSFAQSVGSASTFNGASQAYVPYFKHNMETSLFSIGGRLGIGIFGANLFPSVEITTSNTSVSNFSSSVPGYGTMFLGNGGQSSSLLDYRRSQETPIAKDLKLLPSSSISRDVFSATGQGMSGVFTAQNELTGVLHQSYAETRTRGFNLTLSGNVSGTHYGANFKIIDGEAFADQLKGDFSQSSDFEYSTGRAGLRESYYFRGNGDLGFQDKDDNNYLINDLLFDNYRLSFSHENIIFGYDELSNSISLNSNQPYDQVKTDTDRSLRKQLLQDQSSIPGYVKTYPFNNFPRQVEGDNLADLAGANAGTANSFVTTNDDGFTYEYGLPALVTSETEAFFAINGLTNVDTKTIPAGAFSAVDVSSSNPHGRDNYVSATKTPGYAHSYMLTAVYSPDYVDLLGDGPTEDDLGYYTKFNYSQISGYQWRSPFNGATYHRGIYSDTEDDKASYQYGTKNLYYVNSIETKTHIAEFTTEAREDAKGAAGEFTGGMSSQSLVALKRIDLFSKRDVNYTSGSSNPTPIKSVVLDQSYSLCNGVPNNVSGGGKLTLDGIHFTHQYNKKGALSPYQFTYAVNKDYDLRTSDRWGTYQSEQYDNTGNLLNHNDENPYVNQSEDYTQTVRHLNASAWNLTKIELPSGGEINVKYEQDDYQYVQDRKAMQMCRILGVGDEGGLNPNRIIATPTSRVFFKLNKDITNNTEAVNYIQRYFAPFESNTNNPKREVFFKAFMEGDPNNVMGESDELPKNKEIYVSGYAELTGDTYNVNYGVHQLSNGTYCGWLMLKSMKTEEGAEAGAQMVHPFTGSTLQLQRYARKDMEGDNSLSSNYDIYDDGFENYYYERGCGTKIATHIKDFPSFIRLYNPDHKKYGGGYRVKELAINDNWGLMTTGANSAEYGTQYEYTLKDGTSSGVAAYEPNYGNEENPFRLPIRSSKNRYKILDESLYSETPHMEFYYPAPIVGYSRVVSKSLTHNNTALHDHSKSGINVTEFYTSKDFPVFETYTDINSRRDKRFSIGNIEVNGDIAETIFKTIRLPILTYKNLDWASFAQSFLVETNDMHGKVKSVSNYHGTADLNTLIQPSSYVKYNYKTEEPLTENAPNKLNNEADILVNGKILRNQYLGRKVTSHFDNTKNMDASSMIELDLNLDITAAGVPVFVPMLYPDENKSSLGWLTYNKHIHRHGLLESTESYSEGQRSKQSNLVYDGLTNTAIIASTTVDNGYGTQDEYVLNIPANYVYKRTGSKSENNLAKVKITQTGGPISHNYLASKILHLGDEITNTNGDKYWVNGKYYSYTGGIPAISFQFIDEDNSLYTQNSISGDYYVTNPVNENRLKMTVGQIGSAYNLKNELFGKQELIDAILNNTTLNGIVYCNDDHPYANTLPGSSYTLDPIASNKINISSSVGNMTVEFEEGINLNNVNLTDCDYEYLVGDYVVMTNDDIKLFAEGKIVSNSGVAFTPCEGVKGASAMTLKSDWDYNYGDIVGQVTTNNGYNGTDTVLDETDNPYRYGGSKVTRPYKSYVWQGDLKQEAVTDNANVQEDGVLSPTSFKWFNYHNANQAYATRNFNTWNEVNEITKYSPYGFELENRNPLNIYSSELLGYQYSLVTAVGQNTRYKELAFDGFEDYIEDPDSIDHGHLKWDEYLAPGTPSGGEVEFTLVNKPHTGRKALNINANFSNTIEVTCDTLTYEVITSEVIADTNLVYIGSGVGAESTDDDFLSDQVLDPTEMDDFLEDYQNNTIITTDTIYHTYNPVEITDCIEQFMAYSVAANIPMKVIGPNDINDDIGDYLVVQKGKTYTFSFWEIDRVNNYRVLLSSLDGNNALSMIAPFIKRDQDIVVEGKTRRMYQVTIPDNLSTDEINISFLFIEPGSVTLDDVRLHPFNSTENSFVYDQNSLRLLSELDNENFATFYQYDESGKLVQIKKETVKGISTITTSRDNVRQN